MRNQSGLPIFQKYLAWAQRFFFQNAAGTLPDPHLMLDIGLDWPLETELRTPADYVTVAGNVVSTIYAPAGDRHGLVYVATVSVVAVAVPGTDQIGLLLRAPTGDGARVYDRVGAVPVGSALGLIGSHTPGTAGGSSSPVYVGPGQELRIIHDSVAGGSTMRPRVWVVDRPAYYPLRLP